MFNGDKFVADVKQSKDSALAMFNVVMCMFSAFASFTLVWFGFVWFGLVWFGCGFFEYTRALLRLYDNGYIWDILVKEIFFCL